MTLTEVRREIEAARAAAVAAGNSDVAARLDQVLAALDGELLLTTTEAAQRLGIRSVNTVKAMVHAGQIQARKVGTHYRIPLAEIERLRADPTIRRLVAADRIHDETEMLGAIEGMTQEEMDILSEMRPGTLPWKRQSVASSQSEHCNPGATR